jgi:hypothetical protein
MWCELEEPGPIRRTRLFLVALVLAVLTAGCAVDPPPSDGNSGVDDGPAAEAAIKWDAALLEKSEPCLMGWRGNSDGSGALVALSPDGEEIQLWEAPVGVRYSFADVELSSGRMAVITAPIDPTVPTPGDQRLAIVSRDGEVVGPTLPEEFGSVWSASFGPDGRLIVLAARFGTDEMDTALGAVGADGTWRDLLIEGELPDYHFVEKAMPIPGSDAVALVLKLPGAPGNRDDEALVLARLAGDTLKVFTPEFADDSLVSAAPLWAAEGVVFPRTWREVAGQPVVDLIEVVFDGSAWAERTLVEAGELATGIETGEVVAAAPDGVYWLRSAPTGSHGAGSKLMKLDAKTLKMETAAVDLGDIEWFRWLAK